MKPPKVIIPKASFLYNGYETNFETEDKNFASAMFSYLAKTTKKIKETAHTGTEEVFIYEDNETFFATTNVEMAIVMYKYVESNGSSLLRKTIERLENSLK